MAKTMFRTKTIAQLLGWLWLSTVLAGCAAGRGAILSPPANLDSAALSRVRLPLPAEPHSRDYLGLKDGGSEFFLADIQVDIMVIEIFDMYCIYCQKAAPAVNEFFDLIKGRGYAGQIKLMAIGKLNTQFEIDTYREEYGVAFPVFPDPKRDIVTQLPYDVTPYFYIIRRESDGTLRVLERQRGGFPSAAEFLDAILKSAGLTANAGVSEQEPPAR